MSWLNVIQEAHPLKQGLKLYAVGSARPESLNSRGASIKTRIETWKPKVKATTQNHSRGASIKTRIGKVQS